MLQMFEKRFLKLDKYVISTFKKNYAHFNNVSKYNYLTNIKKTTRWPKIKLNARLCSLS